MAKLTTHSLSAGTRPATPRLNYVHVTMDAPATAVMTDLAHRRAITTTLDTTLSAAVVLMKSAGVRLLLVVNGAGAVAGVLSYRDIVGQKATTAAVREGIAHNELPVSEVMTSLADVEALHYADVEKATVLELVKLMHERGRQHALVTDTDQSGTTIVRGIFSITRISRQLGIKVEPGERARSFSEIEQLISTA